jgi:hypothetical protein
MSTPLDAATRADVVNVLAEKLTRYYIFPDVAERIGDLLRAHLAQGAFDEPDGNAFATALTEQIQQANGDKHLYVLWYPKARAEFDAATDAQNDWLEKYAQRARLDNYGFARVERLAGNVGYLDIRALHAAAPGGETAIAAMGFLQNVHALVIDLRKCGGGEPNMIALLCSYFFTNEPVQLSSIYWSETDTTQQFWTLAYVPGKRLTNTPLYVLTSNTTFSGGEALAYDLQVYKRATLIGETTRGGAHPAKIYRVNAHFDVSIPNGRALNPITGGNWEGTGVTPDIAVPQAQAFDTAYKLALEKVIVGMGGTPAGPLRILLQEAQGALATLNAAN